MKARYDTEDLGHFGLAARDYCHFTSPIRRYPDLMVHRILTALLDGTLRGAAEKKLAAAAARAAVQSSQREIAAQNAEREIEKRYLAEFMQAHLGETFPAAVSGVTRFGLFVMLGSGVEAWWGSRRCPEADGITTSSACPSQALTAAGSFPLGCRWRWCAPARRRRAGRSISAWPGRLRRLCRRSRTERREPSRPGRRDRNPRAMHVPKSRKGRKKR